MTSKTFEQEVGEVKERKNSELKCRLTMVDVPFWLNQAFCEDAKARYNDVYWVKLIDVMRKAEAYDLLSKFGLVPKLDEEEIQQPKEVNDEVLTMGGLKKSSIGAKIME